MLLKFPAYISLLSANNDEGLDDTEKKSAIKFSHIKLFRAILCSLTFISKPIYVDLLKDLHFNGSVRTLTDRRNDLYTIQNKFSLKN